MARNIDNIIVPEKKRSIRDIPIPEGRRRRVSTSSYNPAHFPPAPPEQQENSFQDMRRDIPPSPPPPPPPPSAPYVPMRRRRSRKGFWFAGFVSVAVLALAIASLFNTSTFSYVPKSEMVAFSGESFAAKKTGENELLFSVIKLSSDKGVEVSASGEKKVERKASGTIVVYNSGTAEQKLVENTRFQTSEGLVYRISKAITVPARIGEGRPGSIEAVVYADKEGGDYNIGLSDFTLPGLAGTPKFQTIYARSKTPMSGGFVGMEKAVSEADLAQARATLESGLRTDLAALAAAQVPGDFTLVNSLSSVVFEDLPQTAATSSGKVTVNLRGNLYGVMFKTTDLSMRLAVGKTAIAEGDSVVIEDFSPLAITYTGTAPADILSAEAIDFTVSGQALVIWRTDEVALKGDLLGRRKSEISGILANYPAISSMSATIRPFWKSSFPDDGSKLVIKRLPPVTQ